MGRKEKDSVGSRLRQARRAYSTVSLAEFAGAIRYSASYLSAVELGHLPETEELVQAYEAGLNLSPGTLNPSIRNPASILRDAAGPSSTEVPLPSTASVLPTGVFISCTLDECLATALSLIENGDGGTVYLTSQAFLAEGLSSPPSGGTWMQAIMSALRRGTEVYQFIQASGDQHHLLGLVQSMVPLFGYEGQFQPLTVAARAGSLQEIVAVRGVGALVMLLGDGRQDIVAMSIDEPTQLDLIVRHCDSLSQHATPFMHSFLQGDVLGFETFQSETEKFAADRVLVKNGLSSLITPESWYEKDSTWAKQTGLRGAKLARLLELRKSRMDDMRNNLTDHWYRDICPLSAIKSLVDVGRWPARGTGPSVDGTSKLSRFEVAELLRSQVQFLKEFEHYELALVDEASEHLLMQGDSMLFWVARPGLLTIIERSPSQQGTQAPLFVAMSEPQIADAFTDHFRSIWSRITPRDRDKEYVVWYLERAANSL